MGTNVVQVLGGLLATALLARLLGPAQKGVYDIYLATGMLLSVLLSFALNSGVTYVVASRRVNTPRLMWALTLIAVGEALATLGLILATDIIGLGRSINPAELGAWGAAEVAVTVFVVGVSVFYRAVLVGHREFIAAYYGDVAKQLLGIGSILGALAISRLTAVPLVHAVIFANIATISLTAISYGAKVPLATTSTRDTGLLPALRFSLPSYLSNASQFVNNRLDLFLVYRYWGAAHVGLYQTAVLVAQSINLLPTAMQGILFPTIASGHHNHEEVAELVARAHRFLFTVSLGIAGTLAAAGRLLIPLAFGSRFRLSATSLAILAPGCAVFVTTNIMAAYFAGTGRPHINLVNSLIGTVVTVILDLLVIPRWSFLGASVVSDLSCAVTTIRCLILFQRETHMPLRKLYLLTSGDLALGRNYCRTFATRLGAGKA